MEYKSIKAKNIKVTYQNYYNILNKTQRCKS